MLTIFFYCHPLPVRYPQCLHFLELLQSEHFRRELINNPCAKFIEEQQILHWQFNTQNKIKAVVEAARQIKPGSDFFEYNMQ